MAKKLELKKLLDQLRFEYIVTQVEPDRYVVNEGFKVFIDDCVIREFQIVGEQGIKVISGQPGYTSQEYYDGRWDIVEYSLFKEM